jgi:hypothetical protein
MSRLAEITDGVVTNIIMGSVNQWPDHIDITDQSQVQIGWLYVDGQFGAPPPPPEPPADDTVKEVTPQVFLRQFTITERAAILGAEKNDDTIKAYLYQLKCATRILVDNQDLIDGLDYMETQGHIATGRADEILGNIS